MLEGCSGDPLVKHLCSVRATWSQLSRTMSRWLLTGSHSLPGKPFARFQSISRGISQVSVWDHCLFSCGWVPLKRAWFYPLCPFAPSIYKIPTETLHLQSEQSQLPQTSSMERCFSYSMILMALFWTVSGMSLSLL